jgi:hypothetical protein
MLCGDWHTAEDLARAALARVFVSWGRISRRDAARAALRLSAQRRLGWIRRRQNTGSSDHHGWWLAAPRGPGIDITGRACDGRTRLLGFSCLRVRMRVICARRQPPC